MANLVHSPVDGPARLRYLISQPGITVVPGAYDLVSARLVEEAGFSAVYMTGFGAAAAIWRVISADPFYQEYLAVSFHSPELGKFYLVLDPSDAEQLLVGRFVPREMDSSTGPVTGAAFTRILTTLVDTTVAPQLSLACAVSA